jgi:uncharacterized membrane protein
MKQNQMVVLSIRRLSITETERALLQSILFSLGLISVRIIFTQNILFLFLAWNLFLAIIPYLITRMLTRKTSFTQTPIKFAACLVAWLLFIPNSFYILTDLFHLSHFPPVPMWFDLVLILSFAWNGLISGILSVRQMEKIITRGRTSSWMFVFPVMCLNAFGVYIGRFLRFNSWDILFNPFQLIADISQVLLHPIAYKSAWGMVICFGALLTVLYSTMIRINREN